MYKASRNIWVFLHFATSMLDLRSKMQRTVMNLHSSKFRHEPDRQEPFGPFKCQRTIWGVWDRFVVRYKRVP